MERRRNRPGHSHRWERRCRQHHLPDVPPEHVCYLGDCGNITRVCRRRSSVGFGGLTKGGRYQTLALLMDGSNRLEPFTHVYTPISLHAPDRIQIYCIYCSRAFIPTSRCTYFGATRFLLCLFWLTLHPGGRRMSCAADEDCPLCGIVVMQLLSNTQHG